eukprot:scaffold60348_cov30-Tisochrysis_lutea.AAC.2
MQELQVARVHRNFRSDLDHVQRPRGGGLRAGAVLCGRRHRQRLSALTCAGRPRASALGAPRNVSQKRTFHPLWPLALEYG